MKELKINPPEGYIIDEEKSTIYNIVFKKKNELPATWEEFCEQNDFKNKEWYINPNSEIKEYKAITYERFPLIDKTLLSTKKDAEAHLALIQLHRLRDVYRQGWVPDYNNALTVKHIIKFVNNSLSVVGHNTESGFLTFQSQEIAEQFFRNFEDLIIKAKDLI